jgi:thiaminase (transcriptional activator TenA)
MTTSKAMNPEPAFSARLRIRCDDIWAGLHAHPFIGELTRGTLPLDKFRFFIEQDLMFLTPFAQCMAMGAAKARSEAELEFFTRQADAIIRLEIPSNRRLLEQVISMGAKDMGGSLAMAPANVAYTSFLLATAAAGGGLEITAAILPCSWSYIEIARDLRGELAEHPVYSDWVGFYLSDEENNLVLNMRHTFDDMVREEVPGEAKRRELESIFMMSSRLERMFWEMAYTFDQWPDLSWRLPG